MLAPLEYQPQFRLMAAIVAAKRILPRREAHWRIMHRRIMERENPPKKVAAAPVIIGPRPETTGLRPRSLGVQGSMILLAAMAAASYGGGFGDFGYRRARI